MSKPLRGVSRKALDKIDLDLSDDVVADARPAQIDQMVVVPGEVLDTIKDVFAGTRVADDDALVGAVLEARRAVGQAWGKAGQATVEIGRALNALDLRLHGREERARLKAGFERLFPFSDPIASQFRKVAEAVDSGRFSVSDLPGSYSAAYQLALLANDELEEARKRGLVAPHTTRAAVLAFRRERARGGPAQIDLPGLMAELRRLREQRREFLNRLVQIRRRQQEISRLLED
ncbi:hypothetical protein [Roseomonas chloroacetimidivorans]|uniref:hypothetical protein n=1 Tax=Roseomonas chloroacetimidivorans TaxID=1766656 RepID=UPI003C77DC5E